MSVNHGIEVTPEGKRPACGAPEGDMEIGGVTCPACRLVLDPPKGNSPEEALARFDARAFEDEREWAVLTTIRVHNYDSRGRSKGSKPDDPGWNECTCGKWEGYWTDFQHHVTEQIMAIWIPTLNLDKVNMLVEHLMNDGSREGLILADALNTDMGASARRRAARDFREIGRT